MLRPCNTGGPAFLPKGLERLPQVTALLTLQIYEKFNGCHISMGAHLGIELDIYFITKKLYAFPWEIILAKTTCRLHNSIVSTQKSHYK